MLCFVLALTYLEPHDIRVGVVAPVDATERIEYQLETARPGDAFEVIPYGRAVAAREGILGRELSGALVVEPNQTPRLLVATAAGPQVA